MKVSFITLVLISIILSACTGLQRHENSGYAGYGGTSLNSTQAYYKERQSHNESKARQELGFNKSQRLSEYEVQQLKTRIYLKRLEAQLQSGNERRQYFRYKPLFHNDAERIQFLHIRSMEGRERWAQSNNLDQRAHKFESATIKLIEKNDIALGMNPNAVKESWGDPDAIQIAGNEMYGNQAWKYKKMISSEDGYKEETRVIYFESGRVVGWETY